MRYNGEQKANMPRRHEIPDFEPPMDKARLDEYRRRLAQLDPFRVQKVYREAWYACRMEGNGLPSPRAVQELVTAWKLLWKWRQPKNR